MMKNPFPVLFISALIFAAGFHPRAISADLHYPPYAVPLIIRIQDPISAAMGLTGAAYRSGSLSALTNPAGLADLGLTEVAGVHVPAQGQFIIPENRPQYLNQESLALGLPFHGFVLGGMFLYYNLGSDPEGQSGEASALHFVKIIQVSLARQLTLREDLLLSAGLSLKRIENRFAHKQGAGYSCDGGVRLSHTQKARSFLAGLSVSNIGPDIRYRLPLDTEYEPHMQLFRAGLAGRFFNPFKMIRAEILITLEYQRNLNKNPRYFQDWEHAAAGMEARLFSVLFVRTGGMLDLRSDEISEPVEGMTFGAGFYTQIPFESLPPLHLKLDYGRGSGISDLNQNMISLTLGYDL